MIFWPCALVVVFTVAGTVVDVVTFCPCAFVVVTTVATLVCAVDWKAEVVLTTVLPALSVDERVTGTRTPVWVLGDVVVLVVPPLPPPPPPPPLLFEVFVVVVPPPPPPPLVVELPLPVDC